MKIEILGPGCARCETLAERAKAAADKLGIDYELCKVTELAEMMNRGIMATPALVIDGQVKIAGKVPSEEELTAILTSTLI